MYLSILKAYIASSHKSLIEVVVVSREKAPSPPDWIRRFRQRMSIFELMDRAFKTDCSCEICEGLRSLAHEWSSDMEKLFPPVRVSK